MRLTVAFLATLGNKFQWRTMVFIAISWIPKATVQVNLNLYDYTYVAQGRRLRIMCAVDLLCSLWLVTAHSPQPLPKEVLKSFLTETLA